MQDKLIDQARDLLSKAEKAIDPFSKKSLCDRALLILNEVTEDEPGEKDSIVIRNIRKSFARSLVSQIINMNMNDIETSNFFYNNFILKFPIEIKELMNEYPDFDKKLKWLAEQVVSDFEK